MKTRANAKPPADKTMLPEYDFSSDVRGKYAKKFNRHNNLVAIERDVAKYFADSRSVNEALRTLLNIRKPVRKSG